MIPNTILRCKLIKRDYENPRNMLTNNGKCEGYQKGYYDDEPCELCKKCKVFELYEEGANE